MGNIETTLNNTDSITIDISGITSEQRRLLSLAVGYHSSIPDPDNEGETIPNPMPLIAALLLDSMNKRKAEVAVIIKSEAAAAATSTIESIVGTL